MTIPRHIQANTVRERTLTVLKKAIETVNTLTNEACSSTVTVYAHELEDSWRAYADAYTTHEDTLIGKDALELVALLQTIQEQYLEVRTSHIKAKIKIGKLASPNGHNTTLTGLNISLPDTPTPGEHIPYKLPHVRLPTFSGLMKDWAEFKATCQSVLTDRVSDVQRLQQLKDSLTGEPRELIAHIYPGDGAYDRAMVLLKKRYENPRAIVNSQLHRLYSLARSEPHRESASVIRNILNTIHSTTASLNSIEIDTSTWNSILIYNSSQCLHADSRKVWEEKLTGSRAVPTLNQYLEFLEARLLILETTEVIPNVQKGKPFVKNNGQPHFNQNNNKAKVFFTLRTDYKCTICTRNHLSSRCDELPRLSGQERRAAVKTANACTNCLQPFHSVEQCPFDAACKKCNEKHHTLLHEDGKNVMLTQMQSELTPNTDETLSNYDETSDEALSNACAQYFYHVRDGIPTILATALVPVMRNGRSVLLKALIDQGSTTNLITHKACNMLRLLYNSDNTPMMGIGNTPVGEAMGRTDCAIGSLYDRHYQHEISALVVQRITDISASKQTSANVWKHISSLSLADPKFLEANKIDLLLGATVYAEIVLSNVVKGNPGEPIAQNTKLGYIIFGQSQVNKNYAELCHTLRSRLCDDSDDDLSQSLKAFWEIEEVDPSQKYSSGEAAAEDIFVKSLSRAADGKFMVDLPFKIDPNDFDCLGESRSQAEKRLLANQRRFKRNPLVKIPYDQNLNEYLTLGHMVELKENESARCFLPHHPVIKESSSTTKVRTVFDASAKTSNGKSLNDILHVGPTIQPDLFDLLIQWRRGRYAYSGDIEKMYRMVWINPSHA